MQYSKSLVRDHGPWVWELTGWHMCGNSCRRIEFVIKYNDILGSIAKGNRGKKGKWLGSFLERECEVERALQGPTFLESLKAFYGPLSAQL
jgi:hypothetical protein